jgi:predicted choloylglycine hydrolase
MAMFNQLVNSVSASQIDAQKFMRAQTLLQPFILGSLLSNNYQSTFNQLKLQMFEHNGGIHSVMKQKEYQFAIECIALKI